ncbi:unnamed protein product, partial [Adineta steineri]
SEKSYWVGTRGLLQCCLDGFDNLTFAVTHLDHIEEDVRLEQIQYFKPYEQNIDILMGDMNSLTRNDYSDDYYRNIVADEQIVTRVYGTRVDYIFVHPRVNERWNLTECSIIDTKGVNDHNGVLTEFKLK